MKIQCCSRSSSLLREVHRPRRSRIRGGGGTPPPPPAAASGILKPEGVYPCRRRIRFWKGCTAPPELLGDISLVGIWVGPCSQTKVQTRLLDAISEFSGNPKIASGAWECHVTSEVSGNRVSLVIEKYKHFGKLLFPTLQSAVVRIYSPPSPNLVPFPPPKSLNPSPSLPQVPSLLSPLPLSPRSLHRSPSLPQVPSLLPPLPLPPRSLHSFPFLKAREKEEGQVYFIFELVFIWVWIN